MLVVAEGIEDAKKVNKKAKVKDPLAVANEADSPLSFAGCEDLGELYYLFKYISKYAFYEKYVIGNKNRKARMQKRNKLKRKSLQAERNKDDQLLHLNKTDTEQYATMINPEQESNSEEEEGNPLIHELPDSLSNKTTRWFSNPLFENIGTATISKDINENDDDSYLPKNAPYLETMPKTDKQIRHERRLKRRAREKRKKANNQEDFEIAAASQPQIGSLERKDLRKYDSEEEEYDSDDVAKTLAIGTMILRPSRTKAFVDASYNRYAWNDPQNLPEWFMDNEQKHYCPQLPIPKQLLYKIKEKMANLASKPIKKVAEARARKSKHLQKKIAAAKTKSLQIANSEMSESLKLNAISKAMRGSEMKKPQKQYVVSKKGGSTKGRKGMTLVDKRLKNDKRATERKNKKRKKGKQGGLTGSKKRRHHSYQAQPFQQMIPQMMIPKTMMNFDKAPKKTE